MSPKDSYLYRSMARFAPLPPSQITESATNTLSAFLNCGEVSATKILLRIDMKTVPRANFANFVVRCFTPLAIAALAAFFAAAAPSSAQIASPAEFRASRALEAARILALKPIVDAGCWRGGRERRVTAALHGFHWSARGREYRVLAEFSAPAKGANLVVPGLPFHHQQIFDPARGSRKCGPFSILGGPPHCPTMATNSPGKSAIVRRQTV